MEIGFISILLVLILGIILTTIKIKNTKTINIIITSLALILLVWKILEFGYYHFTNKGIYPVEISHISYFLVSIIILLRNKNLYFTGGVFAFISGLFYMLTAILSPHNMINIHSPHIVIAGMISHSILLLLGLILLFKIKKYDYKKIYIPYLFLFGIFIYVILINEGILFPKLSSHEFVSLKIISFKLLTYIGINDLTLNILATILVTLLTMGAFLLLNYFNHKVFDQHEKKKIA